MIIEQLGSEVLTLAFVCQLRAKIHKLCPKNIELGYALAFYAFRPPKLQNINKILVPNKFCYLGGRRTSKVQLKESVTELVRLT